MPRALTSARALLPEGSSGSCWQNNVPPPPPQASDVLALYSLELVNMGPYVAKGAEAADGIQAADQRT